MLLFVADHVERYDGVHDVIPWPFYAGGGVAMDEGDCGWVGD